MTTYTRSEILANRRKWIDFLKQPKRKKATGMLAWPGGARCCLGHACYVLDPKRDTGWVSDDGLPPAKIMNMLGLKTADGGANGGYLNVPGFDEWVSLAGLNDESKITPQQIGAYLETVIEGGPDTPFKPLTDYPK